MTPTGGFAPPLWGNRLPVPLVPAKTGDAGVDAAVAAFVAKPGWPALKKIHKIAKPAHARALLSGSMLDLGDAYEPSAAEIAALDAKTRRAQCKVMLDFADQTPRGHLFAWLVNALFGTPEDRAHLQALAVRGDTLSSGRGAIVGWLVRNPHGTVDDLLALGRALRPLGRTADPTQQDAAYTHGVCLALLDAPKPTVEGLVPLLEPGGPRGTINSVLDGIESAFSENPNLSDARKQLARRLDRPAMRPLVAPVAALVGAPDVARRAQAALAELSKS